MWITTSWASRVQVASFFIFGLIVTGLPSSDAQTLPLPPLLGPTHLAEFWERLCSRLIYFLPETTANSNENTSPTSPKNVKSVKAERA